MHPFIKKLRAKPETTRKQIAFAVSSVIMLGIFTIWISTFSMRFPGLMLNGESRGKNQSASALESIGQTLDSAGSGFNDSIYNDSRIETKTDESISNGVTILEPRKNSEGDDIIITDANAYSLQIDN